MLETDDIDEDYFIPSNSSTLANIFSNSSSKSTENSSLKYVPLKPSGSSEHKPEDSKTSECIFACSLHAFEWFNNVYTPRGKVGFAIIKIIKSGYSNILLYDSNKSTLSSATVRPSLEVQLKGDTYLSYYDNVRKYWSLYGTANDMMAIVKTLRNINCVVKHSSSEDKTLPDPVEIEQEIAPQPTDNILLKESDTDSSTNRKTKQSVLNRMASMGQSVLPPHTVVSDKTSDSSDTNDTYEHHKVLRHKTSKSIIKKTLDKGPIVDVTSSLTVSNFEPENRNHSMLSDRQLLPLMKTDIISSVYAAPDISVLISEQRQSNSELRLNMGRLSDKMDKLLEKVNDIKQNKKETGDFETTIIQKLLGEYERKNSVYEELIKSKGLDIKTSAQQKFCDSPGLTADDEVKRLQDKILSLENSNKQKEFQIQHIQREHELVIAQVSEEKDIVRKQLEQKQEILTPHLKYQYFDKKEEELITFKAACEQEKLNLIKQIDELKLKLSKKEIDVINYKATCDKIVEARKGSEEVLIPDLEVKVKSIMNDTFQSIAANFNNDENYLGSVVKSTVAAVIKEVTLETLRTIKSDSS